MEPSPSVCQTRSAAPGDDDMPLGRLRALCPQGYFREQPAHAAVTAILAKKPRRNAVSLQDIDLLAARGLYNTTFSPLCRLTDKVLLQIMGYLDWLDMLCIRRTSRVFLRLFGRSDFLHLHDNDSGLFDRPTPWMPPALPIGDQEAWFRMERRLRGESYDSRSCEEFYAGFNNIYMHCNGCGVDHPTCLFSAMQRNITAAQRVCVGHEGHVRLCKHKTVKLSTVLDSLPGGRIDNNYHGLVETYTGWPWQHSYGDDLPFSPDPNLRIVCDHPSHVPDHHWRSSHDPSERTNSAEPVSSPVPLSFSPPPYERFPANEHSEFPSFVVHDLMVSGTKHKVITWSYTAHMDLSGLGDPNNHDAITAQSFRESIRHLRKGHSPARYIAPEDHPGILQELRCIDPNRCHCLVYPGLSQRRQGYYNNDGQGHMDLPASSGSQVFCCADHEATRPLYSRASDLDNIRVRLESCNRQDGTRCLKVIYTRTTRLQGFYIDLAPNWKPPIMRGMRLNEYGTHQRFQDSFRERSVPYGWYQALDHRSYSLAEDKKKYQKTWCRGKKCKLSLAFLRENYVGEQEMNAACRYGCRSGPSYHGEPNANTSEGHLYSFELPQREQWERWMPKSGNARQTFTLVGS